MTDEFQIPEPHPDNIGVGGVTCRCGGARIPNLSATGCVAVTWLCCPTCGEWLEALAV